jgi:hypothetical protein
MQHSKLVVVQTYGTRTVADLAQGTLEAAGIQAMVQADAAGGLRDHLAWAGAGFKVLVREEDATAAMEIFSPPAEAGLGTDPDFRDDFDPPSPWRRFT